jgi:hypothetical protein
MSYKLQCQGEPRRTSNGDPPGHWGSSSITQTPKIDWESLPYHPAGWLTKMDSAYQAQAKSHDAGVNLTSFMNQG